jgi:hypothetical protein
MVTIKPSSATLDVIVSVMPLVQVAAVELPSAVDLHTIVRPPGLLSDLFYKSSFAFSNQVLRI